jgi:hypothetical protein
MGPQADLRTVEALARLQLVARRLGCELRLRHAPADLLRLIEFSGLSEVLRLEPGWEAEEREDPRRVEEERELDDPSVGDL